VAARHRPWYGRFPAPGAAAMPRRCSYADPVLLQESAVVVVTATWSQASHTTGSCRRHLDHRQASASTSCRVRVGPRVAVLLTHVIGSVVGVNPGPVGAHGQQMACQRSAPTGRGSHEAPQRGERRGVGASRTHPTHKDQGRIVERRYGLLKIGTPPGTRTPNPRIRVCPLCPRESIYVWFAQAVSMPRRSH
jgi:hypothetical protein